MKHHIWNVYIILSLFLGLQAFRVKKYEKANLASFDILKESFAPNSDLQCSSLCREYTCGGIKYDGTTCQLLTNVKVDKTSEDKNGWVDNDLVSPKSKFNSNCFLDTLFD